MQTSLRADACSTDRYVVGVFEIGEDARALGGQRLTLPTSIRGAGPSETGDPDDGLRERSGGDASGDDLEPHPGPARSLDPRLSETETSALASYLYPPGNSPRLPGQSLC